MEHPVGIGTVTRTEHRYDPHRRECEKRRGSTDPEYAAEKARGSEAAGEKNKQYPYPPSHAGCVCRAFGFFCPPFVVKGSVFRRFVRLCAAEDPGAKLLVCRGRRLLAPRGLAFGLFTRRTAGFELRHRIGAPLFLRSGEIFLGICAVEPCVFRQFFRVRELLGSFVDSGKLFVHRCHFRFQLRQAAAGTVTALSLQGAQPRLRLRKRAALLPCRDKRDDLLFKLRALLHAEPRRADERRALKYRQ